MQCRRCRAAADPDDYLCQYHRDEWDDLRREYREDEARYRAEMENHDADD